MRIRVRSGANPPFLTLSLPLSLPLNRSDTNLAMRGVTPLDRRGRLARAHSNVEERREGRGALDRGQRSSVSMVIEG